MEREHQPLSVEAELQRCLPPGHVPISGADAPRLVLPFNLFRSLPMTIGGNYAPYSLRASPGLHPLPQQKAFITVTLNDQQGGSSLLKLSIKCELLKK